MSAKTWSVGWVERATGRTLSDGHARCIDVISCVDRPYNLHLINGGWDDVGDYDIDRDSSFDHHSDDPNDCPITSAVVFHPDFLLLRLQGTWSTFDCSRLTAIVAAAHAAYVRVQIAARMVVCGGYEDDENHYFQPCIEVQMNARKSEGSLFERHPGRTDLARQAMEQLSGTYPPDATTRAIEDGAT